MEFSLSKQERELMRKIYDDKPQPPLSYPLKEMETSTGETIMAYQIPDKDKEEVLHQLYPFVECPSMDAELFDIHEQKMFKVRDFMVVREGAFNYLVSPYYPSKGGTMLDWQKPENKDQSLFFTLLTRR